MKLIKKYITEDIDFVKVQDRANPVFMMRKDTVYVYRYPWDWFGFFDDEVIVRGSWKELVLGDPNDS